MSLNWRKFCWSKKFSFNVNKYISLIQRKILWNLVFKSFLDWENSFFESKKHFFDIWSKKKFLWIKESFVNIKKISLIQRKRFSYIKEKFFWINKTFFNSKKLFLWAYIKEMFLWFKETVFSVYSTTLKPM